MRNSSKVSALIAAALVTVALTGCQELATVTSIAEDLTELGQQIASESGGVFEEAPVDGDYYSVIGTAQVTYPAVAGVIEYCPLDSLGRAVCAYGQLTSEIRAAARSSERQEITTDPSGWGSNSETTIPALETVTGSRDYSGWFWNRSHLVADSLGGDAIVENLVTGTRTQNVGSTQVDGQYGGGMAYAERIARDYLDSRSATTCPLYYAATPSYVGDELVPRTVMVDIQSCDKAIDQRTEVRNAANGFAIDYATGAFAPTN